MKIAVLFSGGKDSVYALHLAKQQHEIACLISIISKNIESYMFHVPNIHLTKLQAEAMEIPLIQLETEGEKEKELEDLKRAIIQAKEKYSIQGIVTGAIESVYQATRVQKICSELDVWCFNPLWKKEQEELLRELVKHKFQIIISGIFAYPLTEQWLGKPITEDTISELLELRDKYQINPSGEGGEIETTVLDGPDFKKKIKVMEFEKVSEEENTGNFIIKKAELINK